MPDTRLKYLLALSANKSYLVPMIEEMSQFAPKLHFFVCLNDRTKRASSKASCGPLISEEMVKELKLWIREQGMQQAVYITKTGCLGACNKEGGVIVTYPNGKFHKGFTSLTEIKEFIASEIANL